MIQHITRMVSYVRPHNRVLCMGVKKASTFMETLVVVAITMVLTGLVIEAAFRVYESFTNVKKEQHIYDPQNSHPSGNTIYTRGSPNPPP